MLLLAAGRLLLLATTTIVVVTELQTSCQFNAHKLTVSFLHSFSFFQLLQSPNDVVQHIVHRQRLQLVDDCFSPLTESAVVDCFVCYTVKNKVALSIEVSSEWR